MGLSTQASRPSFGPAPPGELPVALPFMPTVLSPGDPYPLGATWDGSGTNFSVFSQTAEAVELCLFDEAGAETRLELPEVDAYVWHGYLEEAEPGQLYGYRVHGHYDPDRACVPTTPSSCSTPTPRPSPGRSAGTRPCTATSFRTRDDRIIDRTDSASSMPKSIVIDAAFEWAEDHRPRTPWHDTVIYETHVRGLTWRHPEVPAVPTRHLRRRGSPGGDRALSTPRGHGRRANARPPVRGRPISGRQRGCEIIGVTIQSAISPPITVTPPGRANASSTSSRRWCGLCTPPGSR